MKSNVIKAMLPLAAAMMLASCTSEEQAEVPEGRAIDFRPAMATRSIAFDNSNLKEIRVTALLGSGVYFDQESYAEQPGSTVFSSQNDYFWPTLDALEFWAYAPADLNGKDGVSVVLGNDASKRIENFIPSDDIASHQDLIVAHAEGTRDEYETTGMPLDFEHKLAQIEVLAKSDNEIYDFVIDGVRVGSVAGEGTYYFGADGTDKWTLAAGNAPHTYEADYATAVTLTSEPQSVMGDGGNAMVIPQQLTAWDVDGDKSNTKSGAYLSVKLTVTKKDNGLQLFPSENSTSAWAAIPIDTQLEAGKKYIYTLDFTHGGGHIDPNDPDPGKPVLGGPIKFNVNVKDWVESSIDEDMDTSK